MWIPHFDLLVTRMIKNFITREFHLHSNENIPNPYVDLFNISESKQKLTYR
jgi:hypothetical protein